MVTRSPASAVRKNKFKTPINMKPRPNQGVMFLNNEPTLEDTADFKMRKKFNINEKSPNEINRR